MTNQERMVAVTLSRSEMLLIAALLESRGIVGVEPSTAATDEQRAVELLQAEHSLRARNAAMVDEQGNIKVVRDLLEVVATCAYPQRSLIVYHTRTDGVVGQGFGHQRNNVFVFHTALNPELHNLLQVSDTRGLIEAALNLADYRPNEQSPDLLLDLSRDLLVFVRTKSEQGSPDEAKAALAQANIDPHQADVLVDMLSQTYSTTVFVAVEYRDNQAVGREYTLLQSGGLAILMVQADPQSDRYQLQSITHENFILMLQESLQPVAI